MINISYKKNNSNELVSNLILIKLDMCFAIINFDTYEYSIRSLGDETTKLIHSGSGESIEQCQKQIRSKLKELGAVFK